MKKSFFILATAALALASCSRDVIVDENQTFNDANEISFRAMEAPVRRAADQTATTLQASGKGFYVTAIHSVGSTTYFDNVQFKYNAGTYFSDNKYYWPASGTLDFFAYAPATDGAQLSRTDYKTFTVAPSATVADQVDLIYANTDGKSKTATYTTGTYGSLGVPLNFRHAGAKIVVKVKNNADNNLKFEITGVKIVNVDGSATFTYNDDPSTGDNNTDTNDGSVQLKSTDWSNNTDDQTVTYSKTLTANTISAKQTTGQFLNAGGTIGTEDQSVNMILIPQSTPAAGSSYSAAAANSKYTGSYIALKMVIKNKDASETVIADASQDVSSDNNWAMWPVQFTWVPGKKYTYTIDLANGGYWELNHDTDADLDPILENAEIKFVDVTVDDWSDAAGVDVPGPTL